MSQSSHTANPLRVELVDHPNDADLDQVLHRLGALDTRSRRAVLAHVVGTVPVERLAQDIDVTSDDLERGRAELLAGTGHAEVLDMLGPLLEHPTPLFAQEHRDRRIVLAVSVSAAVIFVGVLALGRTATPPLTEATVATTSPTTLAPTTSVPAPTTTASPFVEPDREIEVRITERNTLIREEPWTRRVIWESRPFTDPEIISIDPNTITMESQGNRLIVSLTDGTLLPP